MSKERMEEIKEEYKWHVENQLLPRTSDDNFEWLIEQAERGQELERVNKQLKGNLSVYKGYYKNTLKINEDVIEENKKYRNLIKDMGREIEVLTDVMSNADNADELNEEMIRLKG